MSWNGKFILFFLLVSFQVLGQGNLNLKFDTLTITGLPGLHSFAWAAHEGKWLIVGGRKDGLHPKFGGFGHSGANKDFYVVDPLTQEVWSKSNQTLPDTLREHLQSTNMEFYQSGDQLFFVGGYGESESAQNHITYPYLTAIDVPELIHAIMLQDSLIAHFQMVRDTFFAVTGGQLEMLEDTFYLVGGHNFEGVYSASSGGALSQKYTDAIRKFTLDILQDSIIVSSKSEIIDEFNLHRRDYNLLPQYEETGNISLTAFSGVFQPGLALLPFLNIIEINAQGHQAVNGFNQHLANYHCARVPVYDASTSTMHNLFFGGMSRYHLDANDSLIQDNRIPFVKTVSRVSRLMDGSYEEVAFDTDLPFYSGTGAEFIVDENIPMLSHSIVDFDQLEDGETFLGFIVGGIETPDDQLNPFLFNQSNITTASSILIKVSILKNEVVSSEGFALDGHFDLKTKIFPNPAETTWTVQVDLPKAARINLMLQSTDGKLIQSMDQDVCGPGPVQFDIPGYKLSPGLYWLTISADGYYLETQKIIKSF